MDLYKCMQVHSHKKADEDQYIITSWIIFIYHIEHNTEYRGGGGGRGESAYERGGDARRIA